MIPPGIMNHPSKTSRLEHSSVKLIVCPLIFSTLLGYCANVGADEYLNGIKWASPPVIDPGETNHSPPSDATVLFDGTDMSAWKNAETWTVSDGIVAVGSKKIESKEEFGDCQLHVEWSAPTPAKGKGQGRGNSGIFLMNRYEIQILDSFDNVTYHDGQAGAIYKQTPPSVNAMRQPGQWNTYDIFWTAPRFDESGSLVSPAYITAVHNGVLILNHFELKGDTPYNRAPKYTAHSPKGPIGIQDHGNPVKFRNIWVREFAPAEGEQVEPPYIWNSKKKSKTPAAN